MGEVYWKEREHNDTQRREIQNKEISDYTYYNQSIIHHYIWTKQVNKASSSITTAMSSANTYNTPSYISTSKYRLSCNDLIFVNTVLETKNYGKRKRCRTQRYLD